MCIGESKVEFERYDRRDLRVNEIEESTKARQRFGKRMGTGQKLKCPIKKRDDSTRLGLFFYGFFTQKFVEG